MSPLANTSPGDHSVVYKPSGKEPPPIPSAKNKPIEVNWGELVKLDMKTGKETSRLKKLKGKRIKIPGYVVPLNDDFKTLEEFLFVPNAQACIHAPAPPPNLVIRSKVQKKIPLKKVHNPSWLFGTLEIITTQSFFGKSGYRISDAVLEKYEF